MDTTTAAGAIASNIQHQRKLRDLTQSRLATLAGVPRSTLAHIEVGNANPTLQVLLRLAGALHLSIDELLTPPRARIAHYPRAALPTRKRGRATVYKLLPHAIPGMEIDRFELPVGVKLGGIPHSPGTQEYLCCERGQIRLRVHGQSIALDAGDVATFPGDQPHSYENAGDTDAVAFSVVTLAPLA